MDENKRRLQDFLSGNYDGEKVIQDFIKKMREKDPKWDYPRHNIGLYLSEEEKLRLYMTPNEERMYMLGNGKDMEMARSAAYGRMREEKQ